MTAVRRLMGTPVNNVAAAYWFQCPAEEEQ